MPQPVGSYFSLLCLIPLVVWVNGAGDQGNDIYRPCVFPFIYWGECQAGCTDINHEIDGVPTHWCSTTTNYDKDKKWKVCSEDDLSKGVGESYPIIANQTCYKSCAETGGNTRLLPKHEPLIAPSPLPSSPSRENKACMFPFIYMGECHSRCSMRDHDHAHGWCATTDNYDRDGGWKNCTLEEMDKGDTSVEYPVLINGTCHQNCWWASGVKCLDNWSVPKTTHTAAPVPPPGPDGSGACMFPFIYRGRCYSSCTSMDHTDPWCSTISTYEESPQNWRTCTPEDQKAGYPGTFSIIYKHQCYQSCWELADHWIPVCTSQAYSTTHKPQLGTTTGDASSTEASSPSLSRQSLVSTPGTPGYAVAIIGMLLILLLMVCLLTFLLCCFMCHKSRRDKLRASGHRIRYMPHYEDETTSSHTDVDPGYENPLSDGFSQRRTKEGHVKLLS